MAKVIGVYCRKQVSQKSDCNTKSLDEIYSQLFNERVACILTKGTRIIFICDLTLNNVFCLTAGLAPQLCLIIRCQGQKRQTGHSSPGFLGLLQKEALHKERVIESLSLLMPTYSYNLRASKMCGIQLLPHW